MLEKIILPDVVVSSRINQIWKHSGIDSPDLCLDKTHFKNYPCEVSYQYNSRGFRDDEWPDQLDQVIWCIGDSFTVGIGSLRQHTWPYLLQKKLNVRCINVSLDGASNSWIARHAQSIISEFPRACIVVQWSFLHRRESKDGRQLHHSPKLSIYEDLDLWQHCVESLPTVIHSIIPDAMPGLDPREVDGWWYNERQEHWPIQRPTSFDKFESGLVEDLKKLNLWDQFFPHYLAQKLMKEHDIIHVQRLPNDLARDGFHYDIKTSNWFVEQLELIL